MKMRSLVYSLLFFSLVICQCGSIFSKKLETRMVWESGNEYIRLFKEVGSGKKNDQPVHFHEEDMIQILHSIYYSKYQFFRWNNASRVFEEDQARKLAPHFQLAFMDAGPEDVVEFYLPFQAKKMLGLSGQTFLTRGRAFMRGGRLHFHFYNVQHKIRSYSTHSEDQKALNPSAWKLVPQKGQAYGGEASPSDPDNANLHCLAIDLTMVSAPSSTPRASAVQPPEARDPEEKPGKKDRSHQKPAPKETEPPPPAPATNSDAREKLRELKQMHKEGLITEQDYNRKKQEILKSY